MASPNFTFNSTMGVTTSDGISLSRSLTGVAANAKVLVDDVFGPGPVSVDFAALIVNIDEPIAALLLCEGDGVQLKFDGAVAFTAKAYKAMQLQITPNTPGPAGVLDLEVQVPATAAAQRIRFLCLGTT